jgi:hypothetical protein
MEDKGRMTEETIAYFTYLISDGQFSYKKTEGIWKLYEHGLPENEQSDRDYVKEMHNLAKEFGYVNGGFKGATGVTIDGLFTYIKDGEFSPMRNL